MHRAATWRDLAATLYPVRSIDPRDSLGGKDVGHAATLLAQCADLHSTPATDRQPTARQQRTRQAVNGALSLMGDITAWNARSFNALTRSSQLFLPARALSRDDLSLDAAAAAAKLAGRYTRLPEGHAQQIAQVYTSLMTVGSGRPGSVQCRQLDRGQAGTSKPMRDEVPSAGAF